MNTYLKKGFIGLILLLFVASLSNCTQSSDDDGGGTTSTGTSDPSAASGSDALTLSSQVSVVEAQDDTELSTSVIPGDKSIALNGTQLTKAISQAIVVGGFAADSDYNRDRIDVWVHEESVQAFSTVNEILCSIDQTRYADMKDLGNYRAQIDTALCSSSNDDASEKIEASQNQSSSSNATDYEEWVVNSARAENQPHIIKVWIVEEARDDHDVDKMIMAKMQIYQSASDSNPFGYFKMNFAAYPIDADGNADTTQNPFFKGFMKTVIDNGTGDTLLQFSNSGNFGTDSFSEQATFRRAVSGSAGSGTLSSPVWDESGPSSYAVFNIAYDADFFLRKKGSDTAQCYSRTAFDKTVWDYSMYDNTGARVQLDSGFPIKYTSGTKEYYGWVGYHGLWIPEEANVSNGDTVYKQTYNSSGTSESPYTVFIAGGRLIKHTKQTIILGDLKNVPLQWWNNGTNYRVEWNGSALMKTATLDESNWNWQEIPPATVSFGANDYAFYFWSEALGGSGSFTLKNSSGASLAPSNATVVSFRVQDMVYPTDTVPANLNCFENCPDATSISTPTATSMTKTDKSWYADGTAPSAFTYHSYSFSTSDMVLKDSGTAVVMTEANQENQWGFHSGILFEGSAGNYTALQCEWDATDTCNFRGWENLSVFYTWETGPEQWNKFTAIKSGSTFAKFDPPMKVTYQHIQANSAAYDYKYNGAKFQLEYSGYGNLHGIPGRCIDKDTGENTSCGQDVRWIPEFNILPGSTVTGVTNSTEYVIKPLHVEQRMSNVDLSNCSGLSLTSYDLPNITAWEDPAIGAKPVITDAPAVIAGELQ
ncbi:hypothetical protein KJ966_18480 [bacterium]|nr:hypothetical protein [bacterium]